MPKPNKSDFRKEMRGKVKSWNYKQKKWIRKCEAQIGGLMKKVRRHPHHKTPPEKDPKAYPTDFKRRNSSMTEGTSADTNPRSDRPRVSRVPSSAEALSSHPLDIPSSHTADGKTHSWEVKKEIGHPARDAVIRRSTAPQPSANDFMTAAGPAKQSDTTRHALNEKSPSLPKNPTERSEKPAKSGDNKSRRLRMEARLEMIREQSKLSSESMKFFDIYERQLRLDIKGILKEKDEKATFTLTVRRGQSPDHWIIDIMTEISLSGDLSSRLESTKACLPPETRDKIRFDLRNGEIERTTGHHIEADEDWQGQALNAHRYEEMCMGDSVGPEWSGSSATLGPMLLIDRKPYWLLSWHMFGEQYANWQKVEPPHAKALHPSRDDLNEGEGCKVIGHAVAYSGRMYQTSRKPTPSDGPVETDWVLIAANEKARVNKVRDVGLGNGPYEAVDKKITKIADLEQPRTSATPVMVYSVGRSSGTSYGEVGLTLADCKHKDGRETLEWYIQCISDEETWREDMMGVPGDSGAGVIHFKTDALLGHIWGRNRYKGNPSAPRYTYFTKISTLFDDIQDRFPGEIGRPTLPTKDEDPNEEPTPLRQEASAARKIHGEDMNGSNGGEATARRSTARNVSALARRSGGDWGHFYPHAKTWPVAPAAKAVVVQC